MRAVAHAGVLPLPTPPATQPDRCHLVDRSRTLLSGAMMLLRLLILAGLLALVPGLRAGAQVSPAPMTRAEPSRCCRTRRSATSSSPRCETIAQAPPPAATPAPAAVPIAPDSLGAEVLMGASGLLNHISDEVIAGFGAIRSVPQLWFWLQVMATDSWSRSVLLDTAWRLALVLVVGLAVEWAARRAIQRPIRALVRQAPNGDIAGRGGRRGARRKRRDRSTPPPPRHGPHTAAARAAGAWPLCPRTVAGACFSAGRPPGRGNRPWRRGSATSRAPRRDRRLRALRRHPVASRGHVLPRSAAPAPADIARPHGRLRHALDQADRGGQRVRLRARRGRAAARPVGRRARRAAEGGRAGRSHLSRHHRPAAAPDSAARRCARPRTRAALSPRCETGWRASGTGWRCCCWRRCGSPGRSRCRTATRECCATSAASSWCSCWRGSRRSSSWERSTARWRRVPMPCRAIQGSRRASHSITRVMIGIARALIFAVAAIGLLQLWGLGTFDWLVATDLGRRVLSSLLTLAVTRAAGRGGLGGGQCRRSSAISPGSRARRRPHVRRGCARCCRCCAPRCRSPS